MKCDKCQLPVEGDRCQVCATIESLPDPQGISIFVEQNYEALQWAMIMARG